MGYAVPPKELGSHRSLTPGTGGSARRARPQPVRGCAEPWRKQAQELPAARRPHPARVHVHHSLEIRDLVLAGELIRE